MSAIAQVTGWPLGAPDEVGRLAYSYGPEALREALWNLLLTSPGERLMRPRFGAGLQDFLNQANTESTRQLIARAVSDAVTQWEPRVDLAHVSVDADPLQPAQAIVSLTYSQRGAPPGVPATLSLTLTLTGR
jgi:phage baseplate assembly protein W